jgi:excisionase family DNA binding protein
VFLSTGSDLITSEVLTIAVYGLTAGYRGDAGRLVLAVLPFQAAAGLRLHDFGTRAYIRRVTDANSDKSVKLLTVAEAAETLRVDQRRVLSWIATKELVAMNVAEKPNGERPRWRIAAAELDAFLARRQTTPLPAVARRRRQPMEVIEFY